MEPVAVPSAAGPSAQVALSLRSDLSSVLERGRVLAGEVLELLDGGTVILGLDGRRVNAETHVELEAGQRFLARVEGEGGMLQLRLLEVSAPETALVRALRDLAAAELPGPEWWRGVQSILQLSAQKAVSLRDAVQSTTAMSEVSEADVAILRTSPTGTAATSSVTITSAELRAWIARSGLFHESTLSHLARLTPRPLADSESTLALAERLAPALEKALAPPANTALPAITPERVAQFLRDFARSSMRPATVMEDLGREILRWVAAQGRTWRSANQGTFQAVETWLQAAAGEWLALFTGNAGGAGRARLALDVRVRELRADLKSALLSTIQRDPSDELAGRAREALDGLTREQLLNVARARAHEPIHAWIPLAAAGTPSGLHMCVLPEAEGEIGTERRGRRWTLDVDFTRLGPIHTELLLDGGALHVRLDTRDESTAQVLRAQADVLASELALDHQGERVRVAVMVAHATTPEAALGSTRYLEEHPLLDVSG